VHPPVLVAADTAELLLRGHHIKAGRVALLACRQCTLPMERLLMLVGYGVTRVNAIGAGRVRAAFSRRDDRRARWPGGDIPTQPVGVARDWKGWPNPKNA
jgi:hypothetical protein